ncbi:MAG: hypothetical protein PHN56_00905 [Candidatus Nanoarchaeia archaeon]|nr:hypothetical protein [Candidatus Nanoarchaeia archaeon]
MNFHIKKDNVLKNMNNADTEPQIQLNLYGSKINYNLLKKYEIETNTQDYFECLENIDAIINKNIARFLGKNSKNSKFEIMEELGNYTFQDAENLDVKIIKNSGYKIGINLKKSNFEIIENYGDYTLERAENINAKIKENIGSNFGQLSKNSKYYIEIGSGDYLLASTDNIEATINKITSENFALYSKNSKFYIDILNGLNAFKESENIIAKIKNAKGNFLCNTSKKSKFEIEILSGESAFKEANNVEVSVEKNHSFCLGEKSVNSKYDIKINSAASILGFTDNIEAIIGEHDEDNFAYESKNSFFIFKGKANGSIGKGAKNCIFVFNNVKISDIKADESNMIYYVSCDTNNDLPKNYLCINPKDKKSITKSGLINFRNGVINENRFFEYSYKGLRKIEINEAKKFLDGKLPTKQNKLNDLTEEEKNLKIYLDEKFSFKCKNENNYKLLM